MTRDEYNRAFHLPREPKTEKEEASESSKAAMAACESALTIALDIRKFEIDLYWKRATYFWSFLAVTLAGYFGLLVAMDLPDKQRGEALLTVSCLGFVFSLAWYFVNRASKFWQENWEKHVDLLEDAPIGPLYKTVLSDSRLRWWRFAGPYPFSVSKLNQLLSLFVAGLFLLLAATTSHRYYRIGRPIDKFANGVVALTAAIVVGVIFGTVPATRAAQMDPVESLKYE